jgi:hypothetical protein
VFDTELGTGDFSPLSTGWTALNADVITFVKDAVDDAIILCAAAAADAPASGPTMADEMKPEMLEKRLIVDDVTQNYTCIRCNKTREHCVRCKLTHFGVG